MSKKYALPITIYEALERIIDRTYLLPAIQRKFVWRSGQIETLFDSIMRGYPINSFMFWEIKDDHIKNELKFYEFLKDYREYFNDENPFINTKGFKDFFAIIDGQQRLTSLYIGLKGTYAYKMPRKWYIDCEENFPTRRLYLDLNEAIPEEKRDERKMVYNFKFLTDDEVKKDSQRSNAVWFKVNDLYLFGAQKNKFYDYVFSQPWRENEFAKNTIQTLYQRVFDEDLINYYLETDQEVDNVLDIFIRTNRGGEPLSYSNLLLSFITAHWTRDTRDAFHQLIHQIHEIGKPGFMVDADFLLKTCLVLFSSDIKFRLKNFDVKSVSEIDNNWERISKSIKQAFSLVERWGFNDSNVRAKNALIPIIYYIYHHGIEESITNPLLHKEEKENMRRWFCISLLKRVFGGQSDAVLVTIRRVLMEHIEDAKFPLLEIKESFRDNPSKNLSFDDEFIDGLLGLHKDDTPCYYVMALIYSHLQFSIQSYHQDHLHPAAYFVSLKRHEVNMSDEEFAFYKNRDNWDTIPNLQLLNDRMNESKNAKPLADWVKDEQIDMDNQLIPKDVSLDIKDFKTFVERRKKLLRDRLKAILS